MVVLLEELVFAFAGFVGDLFPAVAELSPALLLCQVVESLDFSLLLLHAEDTTPLVRLWQVPFIKVLPFRESHLCLLTLLGPLGPA